MSVPPFASRETSVRKLSRVPDDRDHWAVFAQADALLPVKFRRAVAEAAHGRPDVDLLYGDDLDLSETNRTRRVRLKRSVT